MTTVDFNVQGMTCGACERHVTEALTKLEGVKSVSIVLKAGRVSVTGSASASAIVHVLTQAGYPATTFDTDETELGGDKSSNSASGCCCR
ncbi:MAG TPA: heavy metal-associated domain-containing protein [Methylotenera sp.]